MHKAGSMGSPISLLVFLVLTVVSAQAKESFLISAPSVFHMGVKERVLVHVGKSLLNQPVTLYLETENTGELISDKKSTMCTQEGQVQSVELEIDKNKFSRYTDEPPHVVLVGEILKERKLVRILVSQHRGYIFIQTDQPIYNPTQKVKYRIFTLDHTMRPYAENFQLLIFNAAGNRIMKDLKIADTGIFSGSLDIPDVSEMGTWKIVAHYQGDQKNAAVREFKVAKFVLPSFEVTIQPHETNYLLANSNFSFTITATYSYGETINGVFHCRVGVRTVSQESDKDGEKENTFLLRGLQLTGSIKHGLGEAELNAITLNRYLKDQMNLTLADLEKSGAHLYIAASVTDITSGELQEAELSLPVVSHRYSIDLSRTRSYFIPGIPFQVLVVVRLPDGSPAEKVEVGLTLGEGEFLKVHTDQEGVAVVRFNLPVNAGKVALQVTVDDHEESKIIQRASPSSKKGYLYMNVKHMIYTVNKKLSFTFQPLIIKPKDGFIFYMVLSRGVLAQQGSVKSSGILIAHQIDITHDMIPSFRLIGFYYDDDDDIVADSVWVDVKDECEGKVEVSGSTNHTPLNLAKFTIDLGDQKGKVALQVVDKAIYALNARNKLTLKQVFSSMQSYDLGCSYGGGKDMVSVLNDAGLSFISSSNDKLSQDRKGFDCKSGFRRHRRSLNLQLEMLTLKSKYTDVKLQECCAHGLKLIPMKRTCDERAKRVSLTSKDLACVQAFKDCCIQGKMLRDKKRQEDAKKGFGRTASASDIEDFFDTSTQSIRRSFPPSFGFTVIDVDKKRTYDLPLQDSITTWELQAVSLSASHGFCVAQPFEFKVFKHLFVSLRLPYSVRQYEQLSIVPVIYNYGSTDAELAVHMVPTEGLCSPGSASTSTYVNITVPKKSSKSVVFSAIPMVSGSIPITIRLFNRRMFDVGNDAIEKMLNVRTEGIEERKEETHFLNFSQTGRSDRFLTIDGHLPNNSVPGSSNNIFIRIEGEEFGPKKAKSLLSPEKIATLIKLPTGCAEQTMNTLAPTALALRYLDLTKRWFELPAGTRDTALQKTEHGYARMMTYKNKDGSYGTWTKYPSSHWLTGLVVKVLSLVAERQAEVKWETGRRLHIVNYEEITHSVQFLLSKQNDDGSFYDPHPVYHRTKQREGSMTAFMTIALKRSLAFLPEKERMDTEASISKSTNYLLSRFEDLEWPFDVAITAYCLAFCLSDLAQALPAWEKLQRLATEDNNGCRVWMDDDAIEAITVETTAYALLTAVAHKDEKWAESAACWLGSQENYGGGFKSTQDTIVAIEALSEYALLVPPPSVNEVEGTFSVQGKSKYHRLTLKQNGEKVETELKQLMGNFINVKLKGQGKAKMKIVKAYHLINPLDTCDVLKITVKVKGHVEYTAEVTENYELYDYDEEERKEEEDVPLLPMFDARTRYRRDTEQSTETKEMVDYEVCFSYSLSRNLTGMAIADITLLSGFEVQTEDLDQLKQSSEQYISHFETSDGRVLLYLNEMLDNRECITFRAKQNYPVGLLQPAQAVFYDYYEPDRKCTVFYSAPRRSKEIAQLCSNSVCQCAERPCPKEKKTFEASKIKERERQEHACRFPVSDYGYIVDILDVEVQGNFQLYRTNVTDILRSNKDVTLNDNRIRVFAKRMHCKLKLETGKKYLIMGKDGLTQDPSGEMQYLLESNSWIEQMPPEKKCEAQKKSRACKDLSGFLNEYKFQGCTQ